jgi:tetratricopeptide (TPR) repeat protein
LTYADARSRATLIASVTKRRLMPPWKSEPSSTEFIGQRHLSDEEIDRIQRWEATGAVEGEARDLPPRPVFSSGWQLGTPDMIVSFPEPYTVPGDGPDFSRAFVLRPGVAGTRYVRGFEFRPGSAAVVHHANIRIDRTPESRRLDDEDPQPGYSGLLLPSAVYPDGHFLGWTPGQNAPLLPKGLSWRLTPDTDLVVEIHFVPSGRTETVRPSIGLYFTDDPPERTPAMLRLGRQSIEIPAGQRDYVSTDSFVLPVDAEIHALQPHAHYRAREVLGTATRPDGSVIPLISIKDWDYRWQHVYRLAAPIAVPKGTTLSMRITFDNSDENLRNPYHPPRAVHWGQRTTDEMGDLWIQMLPRSATDLQVLNGQLQMKHVTEEIVGYEVMIRDEPSKVSLRNDVAVMYAELGQPAKAVAHLEAVVTLQPTSPSAHYNLGTALTSAGQIAAAESAFREALRLDPAYSFAHNNLGQTLVAQGRADEALVHFREAARLDPRNASAHYNVALVARDRGDIQDAIDHLRETVRLRPDASQPVTELAWVLATTTGDAGRASEALRLAERAVALAGRPNAATLDVLAAAQAAAGRFDLAVATAETALRLGPEPTLAGAIRQRLTLYRQRKPYLAPLPH